MQENVLDLGVPPLRLGIIQWQGSPRRKLELALSHGGSLESATRCAFEAESKPRVGMKSLVKARGSTPTLVIRQADQLLGLEDKRGRKAA